MKRFEVTCPTLLKIAVAAALATGSMVAVAAPGDTLIGQTDRMIVKYKDSVAAGKGGRIMIKPMSASRMANLTRTGQQFGLSMKMLHTSATGAQARESC